MNIASIKMRVAGRFKWGCRSMFEPVMISLKGALRR